MIEIIGVIIILSIFIFYWKLQGGDKKVDEEMERIVNAPNMTKAAEGTDNKSSEKVNIKELCVETLRKLNCDVHFDEEDENTLYFIYQGEHFRIDTYHNCGFLQIYDVWWKTVDLDDIDEICNVRKAINNVNLRCPCTVFYTIQEDKKLLAVHTKRECVFIPEIPSIEGYLATILGDFFRVKQTFVSEMAEISRRNEAVKND